MNDIPIIERAPAGAIRQLQEERLRTLMQWLSARSPFYQQHFRKHGIDAASIDDLAALRRVPPTTKDDLQQNTWDFLCVPRSEVREYTSTSGTLGKPVTIALTAKDLERLAYNEHISFACAGGAASDVYQLMLTLDRQFMAGIAYYEGIRRLGAGMVRVGPGLPAMQWDTISRLQPTVLVAVPSFVVKLLDYAREAGIDPRATSVKSILCIGENIRTPDLMPNGLAQRIQEQWGVQLYGTYASTEMQTAFTECGHGTGGHLHPELLIVELLDHDDRPVAPGEPGEVTVTTLGVEGMPLLRYKTGDISIAHTTPCACGRTTMRLGPILGRRQQMIKLKGTTLYPPAVFDILNGIPEVQDFVVEVFKGEWDTDELRLHIVAPEPMQAALARNLAAAFQARIRVVPAIEFTSVAVLERLQLGHQVRKVRRFIDNR